MFYNWETIDLSFTCSPWRTDDALVLGLAEYLGLQPELIFVYGTNENVYDDRKYDVFVFPIKMLGEFPILYRINFKWDAGRSFHPVAMTSYLAQKWGRDIVIPNDESENPWDVWLIGRDGSATEREELYEDLDAMTLLPVEDEDHR